MKTIKEIHMLKDEVALTMEVEVIEGVKLDTECFIDGTWCVSGEQRKEFAKKLESLIQEYCI